MLRMTFTESDVQELHYQRFHHPHPRSQQKMEALLLKAKGLPHHQIAAYLDICENTLRQYFKQYQAGGVTALKQLNYHLPTSDLAQYSATLEAHFLAHPPLSLTAAAATIEQLTGIKRSHTQVGVFLRKLGLRRVKSYAVPAKGNPQVQAEFKKRTRTTFGTSLCRNTYRLLCR